MEEIELEREYGSRTVRVVLQFPDPPGKEPDSAVAWGSPGLCGDPGEERRILREASAVLCEELYRQMEKTAEGVICSEEGADAATGELQSAAGGGPCSGSW